MDIAKYMTTALLLSSVFGEMDSPLIVGLVIFSSLLTLLIGLSLVRDKKRVLIIERERYGSDSCINIRVSCGSSWFFVFSF